MSFQQIGLDPNVTRVQVLISRSDGSLMQSPPNGPLSIDFGIAAAGGAYFDVVPTVGEGATLGWDGSVGALFLTRSSPPDTKLLTVRWEERARARSAVEAPTVDHEAQQRRSAARARGCLHMQPAMITRTRSRGCGWVLTPREPKPIVGEGQAARAHARGGS